MVLFKNWNCVSLVQLFIFILTVCLLIGRGWFRLRVICG